MSITIDFMHDWKEILQYLLSQNNIKFKESGSAFDLGVLLHNNLLRRIDSFPRVVEISKEFTCPDHYKNAIETIKMKAEKGVSLLPYLSDKFLELKFNDQLLNDWGIHHLHLGSSPWKKNNFFVKRTKKLLFVKATNTHIYFIKIFNDHDSWAKQECIQIIHNNWPAIIAPFKMEGVLAGREPTESERIELRENRLNTTVTVADGTIYAPPGMGIALSGDSVKAVRRATDAVNTVQQSEIHVKKNQDAILQSFGVPEDKNAEFNLAFHGGKLGVTLRGSDLFIKLLSLDETRKSLSLDLSGESLGKEKRQNWRKSG